MPNDQSINPSKGLFYGKLYKSGAVLGHLDGKYVRAYS